MSTDDTKTPVTGTSQPAAPRRRRRRWPYIVGGIVVLLAAIIVFVPNYVARYVVKNEMEKRGLVIEGTETFDINLLKRQVWFGPVRIGIPDAPLAEVKQFGVEWRLLNLFQQQALIERVLLSGVDIQITKETDGTILVNGIDVQKLAEAEAEASEPPPPEEEGEESGWGAGLNRFELYDFRVFYTDRQKGTLSLNLDRLVLEDFRMWEPENPGRLALAAAVNDILVRVEGTAKPFGDKIKADVRTQVTGITVPRITRFIGPLGFDRTEGTVDVDLHHDVVLDPDGPIDLKTKGTIAAAGMNLSMPDAFAVDMQGANVDVDVAYSGNPAEKGTVTGTVGVTLTGAEAIDAGPARITFDETKVDLSDLNVTVASSGAIDGTLVPTVTIAQAGLTGPAQAAADQINVALSTLGIRMEPGGAIDASTAGTTTVRAITVDQPVQATVNQVDVTLDNINAEVAGGDTRLRGALTLGVQGVDAGVPQEGAEPINATLAALNVALASLDVQLAGGTTAVRTNGTVALDQAAATMPKTAKQPPMSGGFERLDVTIDSAEANIAPDALTWQAAFDLALTTLTAQVEGGDAADVSVDGIELTDFQVDQQPSVTGAELVVRRPQARVTNAILTAFPPSDEPPSDVPLPDVTVGRFAITDTGVVNFTDDSTKPDVTMKAEIKKLEVLNISTANPSQPMDLALDVLVNNFSTVQAVGSAAPFKPQPDFNLTAKIKRFEMPEVSPYVAQAVGVNIRQGQLSVDTDATAQSGNLNGQVAIVVDKLRFEGLSAEQNKELSSTIGVPVETAVAIMEDANGQIKLTIPVKGDLNSPEFDITRVIGSAVAGAVTAAVTAPFNLLAKGGQALLGSDGSGLQPVTFEPGQATLDADDKSLISGLIRILKEKPNLSLQVCGRATGADMRAVAGSGGSMKETAQKLQALADERTRVVRQAFADDKSIGGDRVSACRAAADASDQGPPRTEISF
jgi:hypothetical protein